MKAVLVEQFSLSGAGRKTSCTAALNSITAKALKEELQKQGVKLISGGLDEAPKNIYTVMNAQKRLGGNSRYIYSQYCKNRWHTSKAKKKGKRIFWGIKI